MPIDIGSNSITGIQTSPNSDSVSSKIYADSASYVTPLSPFGPKSDALLTNDGTSTSWISSDRRVEFSTPGLYTYVIPPQANQLYIEATGGGGGGASGRFDASSSQYPVATVWVQRTLSNLASFSRLDEVGGLACALSEQLNGFFSCSTNAVLWASRTTRITTTIGALGHKPSGTQPGFFMLGGGSGQISLSTDSVHWVLRTSTTSNHTYFSATGGNNLYVMGGWVANVTGAVIISSTNGIEWTLRTTGATIGAAGTPGPIHHLIYQGGSFYGVFGNSSAQPHGVIASTDAIHWRLRTIPWGNGTNGVDIFSSIVYVYNTKRIKYLNNLFWCFGHGSSFNKTGPIANSTDSIHWQMVDIGGNINGAHFSGISDLTYGPSNYVILPTNDTTLNAFRVSTDALTWVQRTFRDYSHGQQFIANSVSNRMHKYIAYSNGHYLALGGEGIYHISPGTTMGAAGGGGGGGATTLVSLSRRAVSGNTITVRVGAGGTSDNPGTATTVSWNTNVGISSIIVGAGQSGTNTGFCTGGMGGELVLSVPISLMPGIKYSTGSRGGEGAYIPSPGNAELANLTYSSPGGGGGGAYVDGNLDTGFRRDMFIGGMSATRLPGMPGSFYRNRGDLTTNIALQVVNSTYPNLTLLYAYGQNPGIGDTNISAKSFADFPYGVGGQGAYASCSLGQTWVARTASSSLNTVLSVVGPIPTGDARNVSPEYINGASKLFMACGTSGFCMTSTDSITWSTRTVHPTPTPSLPNFSCIEKTRDFAIISGNHLSTTTDGINWFRRTHAVPFSGGNGVFFEKVRHLTGTGMLYALGSNTFNSQPVLTYSTDAINWTFLSTFAASQSSFATYFLDITRAGFGFVLCGSSKYLAAATDGVSWVRRTTPFTSISDIYSVVSTSYNLYAAVNINAEVCTSTDTVHWTLRTVGLTTSSYGAHFSKHLYYSPNVRNRTGSDGRFFLPTYHTTSQGTITSSTDGIHWDPKYTIKPTDNSVDFLSSMSNWISENPPGSPVQPPMLLSAGNTTVSNSIYNYNPDPGGDGFRGGGGGGGSFNNGQTPPRVGRGGKGGDGYVRISWT